MKIEKLVLASVFLLFGRIMADEYRKIQNAFNDSVKVVHFIPGGQRGIFNKGEKVVLDLVLKAKTATEASVDMTLIDFFNNKVGNKSIKVKLDAGKLVRTKVELPPPAKFGHYTVETRISVNGKPSARIQGAFSVLPPCPAEADPFFQIDGKNPHFLFDMTSEYHRVGAGSIQIALRGDSYKDAALKAFLAQKPAYKFKTIHGYIGLGHSTKESLARMKAGQYPYSDKYYKDYFENVRFFAEKAGKDVSLWVLQEEVDAHAAREDHSALSELLHHVILVKGISKILRDVTPNTKIAVANSCGDDYFHNDFRYVRAMLRETHKYFDIFAIDAYSGNWNGSLGPLAPPEPKLKELLLASRKMARTFNLPDTVINAERGCFVPYNGAFTLPIAKDHANFNARSMIIAKSVKVPFYAHHGGCTWHKPHDLKRSKANPDKAIDGGLWRSVYDADGHFALTPRPALNSFSTVASQLAFVDDPRDVVMIPTVNGVQFRRPDGRRVLVLWSLTDPLRASFVLPVKAELFDLMNNRTDLKAGRCTVQLTQSPVFIVMKASADSIAAMLKKADFPDVKTFDAFVRRTSSGTAALYLRSLSNKAVRLRVSCDDKTISVPAMKMLNNLQSLKLDFKAANKKDSTLAITDGSRSIKVKVPGTASAYIVPSGKKPVRLATLKYPEDVYPKSALRAERNLFRADGTDISADMLASYDNEYLYLEFVVNDRTHIQRQNGTRIWRDDCIQFAFDAGNNALPWKGGFDTDDYLLGLALTKKAPVFYAWRNGKQPAGICSYKTSVFRKNTQTIYKTAIPWKNLSPLKPVHGASFGFSFLVMDVNDISFRYAPYHLDLTQGITGSVDLSLFKTFILE